MPRTTRDIAEMSMLNARRESKSAGQFVVLTCTFTSRPCHNPDVLKLLPKRFMRPSHAMGRYLFSKARTVWAEVDEAVELEWLGLTFYLDRGSDYRGTVRKFLHF
jgi:hypothetical protein